MPFLRLLAAVLIGFVVSMLLVVVIAFVLFESGSSFDPAVLGGLQVVLWVVMSWSAFRSSAKAGAARGTRVTDDSGATLLLDDVGGTDGSSDTPDDLPSVPLSQSGSEGLQAAPRIGPVAASGRTRWGRYALAGLAVVAVLVASVSVGFWGSRLAATPATTTTTSTTASTTTTVLATTTTTVLSGMDDLTDNEQVWCQRDRETRFYVYRAAETLDYWHFTANLHDYRDGGSGSWDLVSDDVQRWVETDGAATVSREYAQACRAAFETR